VSKSYQHLRRLLAVIDTAEMPEPVHCGDFQLEWRRAVGEPDHTLTLNLRGDEHGYWVDLRCTNSNGKVFHESRHPDDATVCKWLLWIKGPK